MDQQHQQPTVRPSDSPPPYGSSIDTKEMSGSKQGQTQEAKTKTDFIQVNRLNDYGERYFRLPDSMLSATPPPFLSYPDELSYPNALIRKENVVYPAQNSLPLYYLSEATYWSNKSQSSSDTYMYKRHGTFHGDGAKYTTIPSEPECYTAFANFCHIKTKGWKHSWRLENWSRYFKVELRVDGALWDSRFALSIQDYSNDKPVVIKRSVQSENTSEKGWLMTHSWSDSKTNKALAWEFETAPGAPPSTSDIGPSSGDEHRFEFNEAVGKDLRDMLTAAWCISLWIDAETVRREIAESRQKSRGTLGRLARLWQSEEGDAGSSNPEPNKLREKLGLDEPTIPEPPRQVMWYEADKKSTLGAALQSFF